MGDTPEYLWIGGRRTAVHDLNTIFRHVRQSGADDPDDLRQEILRHAREYNYISTTAEPLYIEALLDAYRRFCGEPAYARRIVRAIRIVGPGCGDCEEIARRIRRVSRRIGITVDLQHVSGLAGIHPPGRRADCALVIDGTVKPLTGVPSEAGLHALLGACL